MFHFLQKKMFKKNRNKGTINVLQGESAEYVKDHFYTFFWTLPLMSCGGGGRKANSDKVLILSSFFRPSLIVMVLLKDILKT